MNLNFKASKQPPIPAGRYKFHVDEFRLRARSGEPLVSKEGNPKAIGFLTCLTETEDPSYGEATVGRKLPAMFSLLDQALFSVVGLYQAATGTSDEDLPENITEEEIKSAVERTEVWADVTIEEYEGTMRNRFSNFYPVT